jgi:SAM-dependent methyltransferase
MTLRTTARSGFAHVPEPVRRATDRGTPVDRVYLDHFFHTHAGAIRGRVLEVGDTTFTARHGADVRCVDILDSYPRNRQATVVADLAEPGSLPAATYDCVILAQTLQYVDAMDVALANAWRATRPGGSLLVSVPCVSRVDPALPGIDRWRVQPAGLQFLLERACPGAPVQVSSFGNLVTSLAFLLGLAAEELTDDELWSSDRTFPLVAGGVAHREVGG